MSQARDLADGTFDENTLVVDSTNNRVGIGTSSPSRQLHLSGSTPIIRLTDTDTSAYGEISSSSSDGNLMFHADQGNTQANTTVRFYVDASERMRIDSSGNLLVGKTSADGGVNGFEARSAGETYITATSATPLAVKRKTSDGTLVSFSKDGTTVGAISTYSDGVVFGNANSSAYANLRYTNDQVYPCTTTGGTNDNAIDLGKSNARYDDVYATNGTIQTSDQNEKQQIASLTDAEITAAKAISKLFKTFKWNDAVTEKGDAARTHTGVIAQQVETAMTDAGLNAGDYAFFVSTTWWETQTEVPAVEAVEAVEATYDEDGNVLTEAVEAVEAQEAYTRTDTYDTAEEAPEGATERNRKGIRYPQLLSFVAAATEQRLASIEARLDALESN